MSTYLGTLYTLEFNTIHATTYLIVSLDELALFCKRVF